MEIGIGNPLENRDVPQSVCAAEAVFPGFHPEFPGNERGNLFRGQVQREKICPIAELVFPDGFRTGAVKDDQGVFRWNGMFRQRLRRDGESRQQFP